MDQERELRSNIEASMRQHFVPLLSIEGVQPIVAAGLIAELGMPRPGFGYLKSQFGPVVRYRNGSLARDAGQRCPAGVPSISGRGTEELAPRSTDSSAQMSSSHDRARERASIAPPTAARFGSCTPMTIVLSCDEGARRHGDSLNPSYLLAATSSHLWR
jgi:hypothetical protein